mgnify:CR=1 FL=1
MKQFGIYFSIVIVVWVFIYAMTILSADNACKWVRIFECQKNAKQILAPVNIFNELKPTWEAFLKYCIPEIKEEESNYIVDYSSCNLKVNISKEKPWIEYVEVNGTKLSRDEIDSNF